MPSFSDYMAQYDHEHTNPWNKVLHAIGIPLIFVGIGFFISSAASGNSHWITASTCFLGGWVLLFLGHRIEGNKPAFFQGVIYLAVGPIWVAKEAWTFLFPARSSSASRGASRLRS